MLIIFFSEAFSESEELPLSYRFLKISFYMVEFFIFVVVIRPRSHNVSSCNQFFLGLENYCKTLFFIDIPSRWLCSVKRTWLFFVLFVFFFIFLSLPDLLAPCKEKVFFKACFHPVLSMWLFLNPSVHCLTIPFLKVNSAFSHKRNSWLLIPYWFLLQPSLETWLSDCPL